MFRQSGRRFADQEHATQELGREIIVRAFVVE
jgi:hypothetical protein